MSEMRRAARSLVEPLSESFESLHPLEESKRRLEAALAKLPPEDRARFSARWKGDTASPVLHADFAPSPRTRRLLKAFSLGMALLLAATVWALISDEARGPVAFMVPLFTLLAVLGFPFVALGLASRQAAAESRVRRAIRIALRDQPEKFPPPQRWADED